MSERRPPPQGSHEPRLEELARVTPEGPVDAHDRLLDHALTTLLAPPHGASSAAFVRDVRAAWDRGERGVPLADLEREDAREERPSGRPQPRVLRRPRSTDAAPSDGRRRVAAAFAAVVLGGLGIALAWRLTRSAPAPDPPPVAVDDRPSPPSPRALERAQLAASASRLDPGRRAELREAVKLLFRPGPWIPATLVAEIKRGERIEVLDRVGEDPAAWAALTLELLDAIEVESPLAVTAQSLVDFALEAPPEHGTPLARALYLALPSAFATSDLVPIADRGPFEFQRELVARALDPDEQANAGTGGVDVIAAAWLVARGDARARDALERAVDATMLDVEDPERFARLDRVLLAASLLQVTDDTDAWSRAHARVSAFVERLLEREALPAAALAVRVLEYFHAAQPPPDFPLERYATEIVEQPLGPADAPDALRERLADLAEWSR